MHAQDRQPLPCLPSPEWVVRAAPVPADGLPGLPLGQGPLVLVPASALGLCCPSFPQSGTRIAAISACGAQRLLRSFDLPARSTPVALTPWELARA